jgi:hypothetical protein
VFEDALDLPARTIGGFWSRPGMTSGERNLEIPAGWPSLLAVGWIWSIVVVRVTPGSRMEGALDLERAPQPGRA